MRGDEWISDGATTGVSALPHIKLIGQQDYVQIGERTYDRVLSVEVFGRAIDIVMEKRLKGYPRDTRVAIEHLQELDQVLSSKQRIPMFIAPAISKSSRSLLQERGIGYWDTGGSLHLPIPGAYFLIDRDMPASGTRAIRNLYRGKSTNVLHAMLLWPDRTWSVRDLARQAGVAMSTVHQVFVFLEEQEWVETQGKGPNTARVLREPGQLLDAWAEQHSLENYFPRRFYRRGDWLDSLLGTFDEVNIDYALTLDSGARRVAPFVTETGGDSILIPSSAAIDAPAFQAGLEEVDDGETFTLYMTDNPSALLFRQRIGYVWVASNVQLYLDLWNWPRRGREQAKHLRAERLGY